MTREIEITELTETEMVEIDGGGVIKAAKKGDKTRCPSIFHWNISSLFHRRYEKSGKTFSVLVRSGFSRQVRQVSFYNINIVVELLCKLSGFCRYACYGEYYQQEIMLFHIYKYRECQKRNRKYAVHNHRCDIIQRQFISRTVNKVSRRFVV